MECTYKDLKAWQKAMDLVTDIYTVTKRFPWDEKDGLTSQMRRAAVSGPANIAEGQGRRYEGEFQHFLRVARGSLLELETLVQIATKLHYLQSPDSEHLIQSTNEVGRILNGLLASIRKN